MDRIEERRHIIFFHIISETKEFELPLSNALSFVLKYKIKSIGRRWWVLRLLKPLNRFDLGTSKTNVMFSIG